MVEMELPWQKALVGLEGNGWRGGEEEKKKKEGKKKAQPFTEL